MPAGRLVYLSPLKETRPHTLVTLVTLVTIAHLQPGVFIGLARPALYACMHAQESHHYSQDFFFVEA